jgi:uronate dehydrogenase
VWEAAHCNGVKRVVYASSIHAVGMYPKNEFIGTEVAHRPDTFYGLAKCFAEDLGRMYWEKRGLESIHMRILSCAKVTNVRALGSWLSYDDLIHLVTRCIETPVAGFAVIYGVSNNDRAAVDNVKASFIGYRPKDNAEQFAQEILATASATDPQNPNHMCHGGPFVGVELGNSGVASMGIVNDKKTI